MVKLNVNLAERSYPIYVTTDYKGIARCIADARIAGKLTVITDTNVERHQAGEFVSELEACGLKASLFVVEAGEGCKNLDTVKMIYRHLMQVDTDRSSALIALGGGVVGDVAGFAAATYLRGIPFIQVPTSLLAQADSSVGGKVGVDFEGSKNMIGAFYQPRFVYMNVNSLRTLPLRELKSGLAEIIKHGIIADGDFFEYVDNNAERILSLDENVLQYVARMNCSIKGRVVEQDEKEGGLRAVLNFGHTIGHAIESVSGFRLLHGECVSLGMIGAFMMAQYLGMVDEAAVKKVVSILDKIGLPVRITGMDIDSVYRQMFNDKKAKGRKLLFVLPKRIGEVIRLVVDDEGLIKRALAGIVH